MLGAECFTLLGPKFVGILRAECFALLGPEHHLTVFPVKDDLPGSVSCLGPLSYSLETETADKP